MKGLTQRQREVFDFIREFIRINRYPPTIREIATNFRFSVKGSYDHVKALEKKGFLRCHENRSRAIEIIRDAEADKDEVASVPAAGKRGRGQAAVRGGEPPGLRPGSRRLPGRLHPLRPPGQGRQHEGRRASWTGTSWW